MDKKIELGDKVRIKPSNFEGVVISIAEQIYRTDRSVTVEAICDKATLPTDWTISEQNVEIITKGYVKNI